MRATTTLVLTLSNGFVLFGDPDGLPTPDHLNNWYPFWNKSLGRPVRGKIERVDGAIQREFEHGTVVYNPIDNGPVEVTFERPRRSAASGRVGISFVPDSPDGDLYLTDMSLTSLHPLPSPSPHEADSGAQVFKPM